MALCVVTPCSDVLM